MQPSPRWLRRAGCSARLVRSAAKTASVRLQIPKHANKRLSFGGTVRHIQNNLLGASPHFQARGAREFPARRLFACSQPEAPRRRTTSWFGGFGPNGVGSGVGPARRRRSALGGQRAVCGTASLARRALTARPWFGVVRIHGPPRPAVKPRGAFKSAQDLRARLRRSRAHSVCPHELAGRPSPAGLCAATHSRIARLTRCT